MSVLDDELKSLGIDLVDLEDLAATQTVVGVLYGPFGGGKTRSFDTLPEKSGLYLNVENGERSVVGSKAGKKIQISSIAQLAKVLVALKKDISNGENTFPYLFIDSATDLYKREIAAQSKASAADPTNNQQDPDVPSPRDYMKVSKRVDRVINYAKDMPLTVIFTAAEQLIQDDNSIARIAPAMSPAVRDSFIMYSDFVLYLSSQSDGKRVMLTQQTGKYIAKCRMPVGKSIPPKILNPNLYDVIKAIRGEEIKFETP